jgi:UDP-glucuronate 4-epimerase
VQVVTGAAGFIGSHLVERLLAEGRDVVGIDSFDDYYGRPVKEKNLENARRHPHFRWVEGDLNAIALSDVLHEGDLLYHLAGQPGVRGSWGAQFDRYLQNNVLATQRVMEAAARAHVGRVVFGSSSSVYGNLSVQPTDEQALPHPISPYGVTKLAAEHLVHLYGQVRGISTVALRFFTVFGPRQRPDMAFHRFLRAIEEGSTISLYGQGQWRRDFTYVDDIVDGIVSAGERGADGASYNLGGGSPATLIEVVALLEKVTGRSAQVQFAENPGGEPSSTWADCRSAERALSFRPKVHLAEGLRRQWEWQRGGTTR